MCSPSTPKAPKPKPIPPPPAAPIVYDTPAAPILGDDRSTSKVNPRKTGVAAFRRDLTISSPGAAGNGLNIPR